MSTTRFFGLICFAASILSTSVYAQFSSPPGISGTGDPSAPVTTGPHSLPPRAASGENSLWEQAKQFEPGDAKAAERSAGNSASGLVSLRELEHPVAKKAIQEAREAQQFARAKNFSKAIAKLEDAIRIDPEYREAHLNLGAQYARVGRTADARAEFQKALDIGPPAALIYADLALISLPLQQYRDAETFAHKALELDPANGGAKLALQYASQH